MRGGRDFKKDEVIAAFTGLIDPEVYLGVEVGYQPILQLLALHPLSPRAKRCSDEIMSRVVDSPDEIGLGLAKDGGSISKCGQVFANLLGVFVVLLELNPFRLAGKRGEVTYSRQKAFGAEAHSTDTSRISGGRRLGRSRRPGLRSLSRRPEETKGRTNNHHRSAKSALRVPKPLCLGHQWSALLSAALL